MIKANEAKAMVEEKRNHDIEVMRKEAKETCERIGKEIALKAQCGICEMGYEIFGEKRIYAIEILKENGYEVEVRGSLLTIKW